MYYTHIDMRIEKKNKINSTYNGMYIHSSVYRRVLYGVRYIVSYIVSGVYEYASMGMSLMASPLPKTKQEKPIIINMGVLRK